MNLHEYQAKQLLREAGVSVPDGAAIRDLMQIPNVITSLPGPVWVVKSQIHAGGRGAGHFLEDPDDGGGVRVCRSAQDAEQSARKMLNRTLVTKQTGPDGRVVRCLYVEAGLEIAREMYLSLLLDRSTSSIVIVASAEGGMNIEDLAQENPNAILRVHVNPISGFSPHISRRVAEMLGLEGKAAKSLQLMLSRLYLVFVNQDVSLLEINPLIVTGQDEVVALDAKITIDDNALFRHPSLEQLRDPHEEDPRERQAAEFGLNYIQLDGSIGCLVNGAGLAMATMDSIVLEGGSPANFLDVGGGATRDQVSKAFSIILSSDGVRSILVNIFGGIMRCDIIAEGILAAVEDVGLSVPLVVRLEGTNSEQGRKILDSSETAIVVASHLSDGARKAVKLAKGSPL